jgi:hypothetical protein
MLALHGQYSVDFEMLACRALKLECLLNGIFCFGNFAGVKRTRLRRVGGQENEYTTCSGANGLLRK